MRNAAVEAGLLVHSSSPVFLPTRAECRRGRRRIDELRHFDVTCAHRRQLSLTMHRRTTVPAAARTESTHIVDEDAIDLTLRALALLAHPATALELSRAIRDHFNATASPSRIYVAIGRLWERGHVTVEPLRVRRGSRSMRQTIVTITARGRSAAESSVRAISEHEDAARSAASMVAMNLVRRPR